MGPWDEEDTKPLDVDHPETPVSVSRARLDALCKVMEALLLGRIDAQSLALEVTATDRFARLEAHVQALCQEFLRVTGRRARRPREGTS